MRGAVGVELALGVEREREPADGRAPAEAGAEVDAPRCEQAGQRLVGVEVHDRRPGVERPVGVHVLALAHLPVVDGERLGRLQ